MKFPLCVSQMPNKTWSLSVQSVGLFLQVVTTGLSTLLGRTGNCRDISTIPHVLETSFVGPDVVTKPVWKVITSENSLNLSAAEAEFGKLCCVGLSTKRDYRIYHNRFPFYRRICHYCEILQGSGRSSVVLTHPNSYFGSLDSRGGTVSPVSVRWNNCKKTQNIANWIKPFLCYK